MSDAPAGRPALAPILLAVGKRWRSPTVIIDVIMLTLVGHPAVAHGPLALCVRHWGAHGGVWRCRDA
jgi:hypothetical protein